MLLIFFYFYTCNIIYIFTAKPYNNVICKFKQKNKTFHFKEESLYVTFINKLNKQKKIVHLESG